MHTQNDSFLGKFDGLKRQKHPEKQRDGSISSQTIDENQSLRRAARAAALALSGVNDRQGAKAVWRMRKTKKRA